MSKLFKNGLVYLSNEFKKLDFIIDDEHIFRLFENQSVEEEIDLENKIVIPGLIDTHVHLREPGYEYKETIKTGTRAAAKGGYTSIFAMPNLKPACDCLQNIKLEKSLIEKNACIKVYPICAITKGQKGVGELVDFNEVKDETRVFSDDGKGVQDEKNMELAMERIVKFDGIITAHCEDENELHGGSLNLGPVSKRFNDVGINNASEYNEVIRDLKLAQRTGCRFHVCHISTKESVDALKKSKQTNNRVSGEVTIHHLMLNENDITCNNGKFKMNPPLRSKDDQNSLIEAIKNRTIEVICTDNAPHSEEEKDCEFNKASFGIVENEIAFALIYTRFVKNNILTLKDVVELMSLNPARIFGVKGGQIIPNEKNDIAIFDLHKEFVVDSNEFVSMGKSCPFDGYKLFGKCVLTMVDGEIVFREGI